MVWRLRKGPRCPLFPRRTFELKSVPDHATLYVAGPRSANISVNGQQVGSYQLNLDFPMGIRVFACDVTPALRSGKNVLAIEAVRGPRQHRQRSRQPSQHPANTRRSARRKDPARGAGDSPVPLCSSATRSGRLPCMPPPDGQQPGFDDQSWHNADTLGGIEGSMEFFQWNANAGMYAWPGYDGICPSRAAPMPPRSATFTSDLES